MDVVITVPKSFGWENWIAEGDPAGSSRWSGLEWHFYLSNRRPKIDPGERVYVVFNGKLRGYAPLVKIDEDDMRAGALEPYGPPRYRYALVRHGDAVAVTIPRTILGFRGFRYRFWEYGEEVAFPDWRDPK
jgi:hypothetical protein